MKFLANSTFAKQLDTVDPLKRFRKQFLFPKRNGKVALYFTGNSLGLQPVKAKQFILEELSDWAKLGVEGHFRAKRPWLQYHKFSQKALAAIAGAKVSEVVSMNQLTVNLHVMMTTFFRPTAHRYKIIAEEGAFSSDQYAFESQLKLHGLDSGNALVEIRPRTGESTLRTEDILATIAEHGEQTALVIFGGVQYYSGQFFDINRITKAAHAVGAYAGFDLAHALGNVPLNLHNDGVDFAVWCSYKYLNSGPGSIAGAFVHETHGNNPNLLRLAGWWGHHQEERFKMQKGFRPMPGVEGWQLSNFPVLAGAAQLASLALFQDAGMKALRKKSILLTGYLEFLLREIKSDGFTIITPSDPNQRGCQLSILMHHDGKRIFKNLEKQNVIADWREPNVIRIAPTPLYNSFTDVFQFYSLFKNHLISKRNKNH